MTNELLEQKSWWQQNWKRFLSIIGFIMIFIMIFISSGLGRSATDLTQAYADDTLYKDAIEKANSDQRVTQLIGIIKPIDNLAILEGQVDYSNDNKTVNSTIRVVGTKGKAIMDISADHINGEWNYKTINIRIKNPPENKQTIEIITAQ